MLLQKIYEINSFIFNFRNQFPPLALAFGLSTWRNTSRSSRGTVLLHAFTDYCTVRNRNNWRQLNTTIILICIESYDAERLANGLNRVIPLDDLRKPLTEGYFPKLTNSIGGYSWAGRPSGLVIQVIAFKFMKCRPIIVNLAFFFFLHNRMFIFLILKHYSDWTLGWMTWNVGYLVLCMQFIKVLLIW